MTQPQALREARRRWSHHGSNGYVKVATSLDVDLGHPVHVGDYCVGYTAACYAGAGAYGREFIMKGHGVTWDAAFADADRQQG